MIDGFNIVSPNKKTVKKRITVREIYSWLQSHKEFISKNNVYDVFLQMQNDGIFSQTYNVRDAYPSLQRRILEVLQNQEKYK